MKESMVCAVIVPVAFVGLSAVADTLTIPMEAKSAIAVDGVFAEGEYDRASMIDSVIQKQKHRLVARDVEVYLAADAENLYIAGKTPVEGSDPDGCFVSRAKDGSALVCLDDCYELFVAGAEGGATNVYQLLVNAAGARAAFRYANGKGAGEWTCGAKSACAIRNEYWFLEVAIPWASMPGVSPKDFRFNAARNFVRAGFGYTSLTGQEVLLDARKFLPVHSAEGFPGVKVRGLGTRLTSARFRLACECAARGVYMNGEIFQNGKTILKNDPKREQAIPRDDQWKGATVIVTARDFGTVYHRSIIPFETGTSLAGAPVTRRCNVDGLGTVFTRFYPCASKTSVIVDGLPDGAKDPVVEVASPDGQTYSAPLAREPDHTVKGMVLLPPEKTRKAGEWKGTVRFTAADGTVKSFADVWGFEEKKFPWQHNTLGLSEKVLAPFTPIEVEKMEKVRGGGGQWILKTVLREHELGADGLVRQVKAKGDEILAAPMAFEAVVDGTSAAFEPESFQVVSAKPTGAKTRATGRFGAVSYRADVEWDYDGFALVTVTLKPLKAGVRLDRFTLNAPLKKDEATLFHALVDLTRGNPAGLLPAGEGIVWDSSKLGRRMNSCGQPNFPGEFTPYLWFGGEEKGLAFVFDCPKGFDLEDGRPMIRLVRAADRVTAACDAVNRPHALAGETTFQFGFEATPVKPLVAGSEKWVPFFGSRLPGMVQFQAIANATCFGLFPGAHMHLPDDPAKWKFAEAYRKAMRERRIDFDVLKTLMTTARAEKEKWVAAHKGGQRVTERSVSDFIRYTYDGITREAMSTDRVIPYTCASIHSVTDEAYAYYKSEWATMAPYLDGQADRVFLTPDTVDYLLWTHRELLKHGADGLNFDETWIVSQTNPDLAEARDYKGRPIPNAGILPARRMFRRLAHLMDDMGIRERMIAPHYTNTIIIPEFAFCTIGIGWEYGIFGNFTKQFPPDYCRALSTGLQLGVKPLALVLYHDPDRNKKPVQQFYDERGHSFRTAVGILIQHGIQPMEQYWGDFVEQWRGRYVLWAFGTHKPGCEFLPYWRKDNPFAVSEGFLLGAYRHGSSTLFMLTNCGKAGAARLTFDAEKLGLPKDAKLTDIYTGETFANGARVAVPECEYRYLFAGPAEFGAMLAPPDPDWGYIIK